MRKLHPEDDLVDELPELSWIERMELGLREVVKKELGIDEAEEIILRCALKDGNIIIYTSGGLYHVTKEGKWFKAYKHTMEDL